jgi:hypothetical protein
MLSSYFAYKRTWDAGYWQVPSLPGCPEEQFQRVLGGNLCAKEMEFILWEGSA